MLIDEARQAPLLPTPSRVLPPYPGASGAEATRERAMPTAVVPRPAPQSSPRPSRPAAAGAGAAEDEDDDEDSTNLTLSSSDCVSPV